MQIQQLMPMQFQDRLQAVGRMFLRNQTTYLKKSCILYLLRNCSACLFALAIKLFTYGVYFRSFTGLIKHQFWISFGNNGLLIEEQNGQYG
nr:hypothetical protein Iba_chr03dCG8600 [Ipomoea batatas]